MCVKSLMYTSMDLNLVDAENNKRNPSRKKRWAPLKAT